MAAERASFKPYIASRSLDIPTKGSGAAARAWVRTLEDRLGRAELAVALAFAWYADAEGYCWPSYASIAKRSKYTTRQVQRVAESLIARGVLVEAGSKVSRDKDGGIRRRTRLYRLALSALVPVMPATERRRLARELTGETAKMSVSIGQQSPLSKLTKVHSRAPAAGAIQTDILSVSTPVETDILSDNPKNYPGNTVGGGEGVPLSPAPPPPADRATNVRTVAAREAKPRELTPAEMTATIERRRAALKLPQTSAGDRSRKGGGNWWDALPPVLTSAGNRPNRPTDNHRDWRRGAKA